MNKKIIITVVLIFGFVFIANKTGLLKKLNPFKKMNDIKKNFTEQDFKNAIIDLKNKGIKYEVLAKLEQLYRLETNHFKSGQYKGTGTSGMETKEGKSGNFPYGWSSLKSFSDTTGILPAGLKTYTDNQTKKVRNFIVFDSVKDAILFFIHFIYTVRKGEYWKWNTLDVTKGMEYKKSVDSMKYPITKQIFNK